MDKLTVSQMERVRGGSSVSEHNTCLAIGLGAMIVGLGLMVCPPASLAYAIASAVGGVSGVVGFYASVLSC